MRLLRPKSLLDIQTSRDSVYRARARRINLDYHRTRRVALTAFLKLAAVGCAVWFLVVGLAAAPTMVTRAQNAVSDEERKSLEDQLHTLESQIDQYEDQIVSYQKQGGTLKNEISKLDSKVAKLNLQIKAVQLTLAGIDQKIGETQTQIRATEGNILSKRAVLSDLLKSLYENDNLTLVEIFLKHPKLSDFFSDLNSLALLQNNVRTTIIEISNLRDQLEDQKDQFALARADAATLQEYQVSQKGETSQLKQQKNDLLAATKGQESKYQSLLKQTKETAAQIRSRIFQLLGGGELSFEQAYQYAKLASGATGVRAALILAVLDRESALGKNVGRCSYTTAMSPKNQQIFLTIVAELNISPDAVTVSCPNADGVYGGAMGPAQFIPSTWQLYRDAVSQITGRTPASPWNNADAFVATALYLRDAGAANASIANERRAAARYYAGGNWQRYLWTYGEAVISRAQRFQQDIDTITG